MFSTVELTVTAASAIASIASWVNSRVRPSVPISAVDCLITRHRCRSGSDQVFAGQRLELDADRQAALQFRKGRGLATWNSPER